MIPFQNLLSLMEGQYELHVLKHLFFFFVDSTRPSETTPLHWEPKLVQVPFDL